MRSQKCEEEGEKDTDVAPFMSWLVRVGELQEGRTGYDIAACRRADGRTNAISEANLVVWSARGHERAAGKFATSELVQQQSFEAVRDRVDVVDPPCPAAHVVDRYGVSRVDHQGEQQWSGGSQSLC